MAKINEKAIKYIRQIPPPFRIIVEDLRNLIFKVGDELEVTESFENERPEYYIEGKPYFFIEKLPKHHINFGLIANQQKELNSKRDFKHIEIQSKEDIETLGIADLIKKTLKIH